MSGLIIRSVLTRRRRYRGRTWLRAHTPYFMATRIPKGAKDCGDHEWYRATDAVEHCYHCLVGRRQVARRSSPPRATVA